MAAHALINPFLSYHTVTHIHTYFMFTPPWIPQVDAGSRGGSGGCAPGGGAQQYDSLEPPSSQDIDNLIMPPPRPASAQGGGGSGGGAGSGLGARGAPGEGTSSAGHPSGQAEAGRGGGSTAGVKRPPGGEAAAGKAPKRAARGAAGGPPRQGDLREDDEAAGAGGEMIMSQQVKFPPTLPLVVTLVTPTPSHLRCLSSLCAILRWGTTRART